MTKPQRHRLILDLIGKHPIRTQAELASELTRKSGAAFTQVTLSRDIRELGLVKTPAGYQLPDQAHRPGPDLAQVIRDWLEEIRVAQNIVVLRTLPAYANSLAAALDEAGWPEIVGTIAGDDTVFVVAPDNASAIRLRRKLTELLS